jgi:hypothetical protein
LKWLISDCYREKFLTSEEPAVEVVPTANAAMLAALVITEFI